MAKGTKIKAQREWRADDAASDRMAGIFASHLSAMIVSAQAHGMPMRFLAGLLSNAATEFERIAASTSRKRKVR